MSIVKGIGAFGRVLTHALLIKTGSVARVLHRKVTKSSWTIPRGRSCPFRTRRRSTSPLPRCTSGARTGAWKAIASTTTSGDVAVRVALQEEPLSRFMIMSDRASTIPDITPAIAESRTHDDAAARFLAQFSTTCREEALHLAFKPCGPASSPIVSSRANSRGRFISAATESPPPKQQHSLRNRGSVIP